MTEATEHSGSAPTHMDVWMNEWAVGRMAGNVPVLYALSIIDFHS